MRWFLLAGLVWGLTLAPQAARAQSASVQAGDVALVYRGGVRPAVAAAPARMDHAPARILDARSGTAVSDTLLNDPRPPDPWLAFDKAQHVAFSMLSTLSAQYALVNKLGARERTALPISAASSAAVGLAKEWYDARSARGVASRRDLVADAVGILLATGLILL